MAAYKRILLKLSGEALMGDDAYGINRATRIQSFTLYVVGEGIEKKVDDFAAEVAAQVAAAKGA